MGGVSFYDKEHCFLDAFQVNMHGHSFIFAYSVLRLHRNHLTKQIKPQPRVSTASVPHPHAASVAMVTCCHGDSSPRWTKVVVQT